MTRKREASGVTMNKFRLFRAWLAPAILAVTLSSHVPPVFAWGNAGHIIVGDIAEHYLSPSTHEQVKALLAADGSASLGAVATWADEIKSDRPNTKPWHYVDIPVCGQADPNTYCPNGQCVTEQIKRFAHVLGNHNASQSERIEALKFLTHLVGDIHQPLHAADNHDYGGNDIHVSFLGQGGGTLNLHAIWDTDMIEQFSSDPGDEANILVKTISAQDVKIWSAGTVDNWAAESHQLAINVAYGKLPGGFACGKPEPENVEIGRKYYRQAKPVIEKQLKRAGVRLAFLLNQTLDSFAK